MAESSYNPKLSLGIASSSQTQAQTDYQSIDSGLSGHVAHEDNGIDDQDHYDGEDAGQEYDDNDSAFGGSLIGCDTDTLASFITDYQYENGRRYHAYRDGEYWVMMPHLRPQHKLTWTRDPTMNPRTNNKTWHIICT